jgi:hypothetical protein
MSKFPNPRIEALYADTPDEEVGDVSLMGWAGLYAAKETTTIIREDSDGNITVVEGKPSEMAMTWADLQQELGETEEPADEDYVISPTRDGWSVRNIGETGPEYDAAIAAIVADLKAPGNTVFPDTWLEDDHGGFTNISEDIQKAMG